MLKLWIYFRYEQHEISLLQYYTNLDRLYKPKEPLKS